MKKQRRWSPSFSIFQPGTPEAQGAVECSVLNDILGDHLRLHLPGLLEVSFSPGVHHQPLTPFSAFNAIVSSSVVMLDISYVMPIAINCIRGRKMLPERHFVLPKLFGWIANMVCLTSNNETSQSLTCVKGFHLLHLHHHCALPLPA